MPTTPQNFGRGTIRFGWATHLHELVQVTIARRRARIGPRGEEKETATREHSIKENESLFHPATIAKSPKVRWHHPLRAPRRHHL